MLSFLSFCLFYIGLLWYGMCTGPISCSLLCSSYVLFYFLCFWDSNFFANCSHFFLRTHLLRMTLFFIFCFFYVLLGLGAKEIFLGKINFFLGHVQLFIFSSIFFTIFWCDFEGNCLFPTFLFFFCWRCFFFLYLVFGM